MIAAANITDLEVDTDLAVKLFNFRWHDFGIQPTGQRLYVFIDTQRVAADVPRLPEAPVLISRNGVLFNAAGEWSGTNHVDMPRPSQCPGAAWNLIRFVNRQHELCSVVNEMPAPAFPGEKFTCVISWHRATPDGRLVANAPEVAFCAERTLERAATRGVLVLLETLAQGASPPAPPPNPPPVIPPA